jgi:phospholipid/cholesterol/gamma-HCH transport system substrate-binding protein
MASKRTKFVVGLFISSGMALAFLAFVLLGVAQLFKKGEYYVTFFDQSVQGLSKDSPVKYRGVPVGSVEKIEVAPDSKLIQVVMRIESGQKLEKNIVAQLKPVGITGSVFIGLDQTKEGEPSLSPKITFPTPYPIVPSKPSEFSTFLTGIDEVLNDLKSLDLKAIPDKISGTLDHLNQVILSADVKGISEEMKSVLVQAKEILNQKRWDRIMTSMEEGVASFRDTMAEAEGAARQGREFMASLQGVVSENAKPIRAAVAEFQRTMEQANVVIGKGNRVVSTADERIGVLYEDLRVTLRNAQRATENLSRLLDRLSEQPSLLLYSRPPEPRL